MQKRFAIIALTASLLLGTNAEAGRSCESHRLTAKTLERGLQLAEQAMTELNAEHARTGARVVVLGRAGQDLSKYGLRYSHLGFAYRTSTGDWRVLHKLNHCGTADASLYRQGLGEFFLDDLWRHEAAWVVPHQTVQDKLIALLSDEHRVTSMHHKPYSIVSYVWGAKYQQSNQWAIETLASAMEAGAASRDRAQAWLMFKGYEPTSLRLGPLTRLGGRIGAANVAFDDHPDRKRYANDIETVTVDSVFAWLQRSGLGGATRVVRLP